MANRNSAAAGPNPYGANEGDYMADANDPIQQTPPTTPPPLLNQEPPKVPSSQPSTPPTPPPIPPVPPTQSQPKKPTPSEPEQQSVAQRHASDSVQPPVMPKSMSAQSDNMKLIGGTIAVIVIIGIIYFFISSHPSASTTVTTSTIPNQVLAEQINSCTQITTPGSYTLTGNITYTNQTGSCIQISSSNVNLQGNGYHIIGSGPFVSTPPYTYGINLGSVSNVIINGLLVAKFSYGIYINNSFDNVVSNTTVQNITISGIYLNGASHNLLLYDLITSVSGQGGAIFINNGGNNTVSGSAIRYNTYVGVIFNSKGNRMYNDTMIGNPIDLQCSTGSGYSSYNNYSASTCYVNHYCNFASCSEQNIPDTPQAVSLGPSVNSCGYINSPGTYSLSGDLNTPNFINESAAPNTPCITINASNVDLSCNGYSINNGAYGIYGSSVFNVTVSDCGLQNDNYGLYFDKVLKFNLHNINATGGNYGIYLNLTSGGNLTDITTNHNKYGTYLNGSTYATLTRFTTTNNTYGVFMDNSTSVSMDTGTLLLNSKADLYCSANTYNSTFSTISDSQCSTTDCNWAAVCPIHYLPNLNTYPITQCTSITVPGQYSLNTNLVGSNSGCFTVDASNVSIECNNHEITGQGSGSGVIVNNVSNVALFGCTFAYFTNGISSIDTQYLVLQNLKFLGDQNGESLIGAQSALISNNTAINSTHSGYYFSGMSRSVVTADSAISGISPQGTGFSFSRAINNTVINNTALNNKGYGFSFSNDTTSNFVYNNTGDQNGVSDYICSSGSTSAYANNGRLNSGLTKMNCNWLAAVPPVDVQLQQQCTIITSPTTFTMKYDMFYPYGNTCFEILSVNSSSTADNSVFNCQGHTVYASDGGTFIRVSNTSSVTVENCILYGFTTPIVVTSPVAQSNIKLINNTLINSSVGISIANARSSVINENNVTNAVTGILASSINNSQLEKNSVSGTTNGIVISASFGVTLSADSSTGAKNGLSLANVTESSVQSSNLQGTSAGILCTGSSAAKSSGNDAVSGNSCSASTSCQWISSSSGC